MEEKNNKQECNCQEQEQTKKKRGCVGRILKGAALVGAGAVVTHEVMTNGSWIKAATKGVKSLINKNKSGKDMSELVVEEEVFVPRREEFRNERRDFHNGNNRQQFNKH